MTTQITTTQFAALIADVDAWTMHDSVLSAEQDFDGVWWVQVERMGRHASGLTIAHSGYVKRTDWTWITVQNNDAVEDVWYLPTIIGDEDEIAVVMEQAARLVNADHVSTDVINAAVAVVA